MTARWSETVKTAVQIAGIAVLILIFAVIAHKGYTDVSRIARDHPRETFWPALGRYFFGNLAGGSSAGKQPEAAPKNPRAEEPIDPAPR